MGVLVGGVRGGEVLCNAPQNQTAASRVVCREDRGSKAAGASYKGTSWHSSPGQASGQQDSGSPPS